MVDYQKEVGWVLMEEDGRLCVRSRMRFNGGRWKTISKR